jgi:kynurenine formamidase
MLFRRLLRVFRRWDRISLPCAGRGWPFYPCKSLLFNFDKARNGSGGEIENSAISFKQSTLFISPPKVILSHLLIVGALAAGCQSTIGHYFKPTGKIIDLTHPLDSQNPFRPGNGSRPFQLETLTTLEQHGFLGMAYWTPEHLGTHVDGPNHFAAAQIAVDEIALENFFAPAVKIDIRDEATKNPNYKWNRDDLDRWEQIYGHIPAGAIVFLYTGWSERWKNPEAYKNADKSGVLHFPAFAVDAVEFLIKARHIKAIGIDNLSVDPGQSADFKVHKVLNGAGKYALENVANLDKVPPRDFHVIVAPIKIRGGSGGQTRIFALLP